MKRGLIVYNASDVEKNQWFIDRCLELLNDKNCSLSLLVEDKLIDFIDKHHVDYVIYRGRNYHLLEALEHKGIKTFNNALTNKTANDKRLIMDLLQRLNIHCIETNDEPAGLNYPYIMKSVSGHGGKEVYLIHNNDERKAILEQKSEISFIYQEYLPNDGDVRLYVLDDKVIVAVKRLNNGDYRNNYSLGGNVSLYEPSERMINSAILIAKSLSSSFIGVDFLLTKDGYRIIEIEDPVGCRMLYKTSNIDIIKSFCELIKEKI